MARILLADNSIVVRRGLRGLLEARKDFEVCADARDGREAIELAARHKPDIAILDIPLMIVGGIEATRQIRRETPTTEVLIFTLLDGKDNVSAALHAGARGYVLKSEADEEVVRAIEALAHHREFLSDNLSESMSNDFHKYDGSKSHSTLLTAREREVVRLIAEGESNKNIAYALEISAKTVESHRSASMRKLKVHSTAQLVRYAIRRRLIQP